MSNEAKGRLSSIRAVINRLKTSTILADKKPDTPVPDAVIDTCRALADPSDEDPHIAAAPNAYEYARRKFNKIWAGRAAYETNATPVSEFTTLRGAVTAYWTSEKWKTAWMCTGAIAGLTALSSQTGVWMAETSAQVANSISHFDVQSVLHGAQWVALLGGLDIANSWVQGHARDKIERDMSFWMTDKFREATFEQPDIVYRIAHNKDEKSDAPDVMPDSPAQRIGSAPHSFALSVLSMGDRTLSATLTSVFVAKALWDNSVPVDALNRFGEKLNAVFPHGQFSYVPGQRGSFIVACTVLAAYFGACTPIAIKMSKKLQAAGERISKAGGKMSEVLYNAFNNGESIAASRGHQSVDKAIADAHAELNAARRASDLYLRKYFLFRNVQNFIGDRAITAIPAFIATFGRTAVQAPVQVFVQTQQLVSSLMSSTGTLVDTIPDSASMMTDAKRVIEMAQMFEKVKDRKKFYSLSGIHEFDYVPLDEKSDVAIQMTNVGLMHRGQSEAFLRVPDITIRRSEWVHVRGEEGSGKSSLVKAMRGLWPYGRGTFQMSRDAKIFYAHQKADLTGSYTLSEQLLYGMRRPYHYKVDENEKSRMKRALEDAGLSEFEDFLDQNGIGGRIWDEILSGGQRQKLVLARILFQQPDIILLDEPTAGLPPAAKVKFFNTLKACCPQATVLAITHDGLSPDKKASSNYFNTELTVKEGLVSAKPFEPEDDAQGVDFEGYGLG